MNTVTTEQFEIAIEAETIVEIEAAELDVREDMTFCNFSPIMTVRPG